MRTNRFELNKWARIAFASIALHLGCLSIFSFFHKSTPQQSSELLYVEAGLTNSQEAASSTPRQEDGVPSPTDRTAATVPASSTAQSAGSSNSQNISALHTEIRAALVSQLQTRPSVAVELMIELGVEEDGSVFAPRVLRSSGFHDFDEKILVVLRGLRLKHPSKRLLIQVPIKFI